MRRVYRICKASACAGKTQKGKEEEKRTIARNMKSFGMTPEAIAQMTGLSLEEIEAI